jgi:hypothetical protein
MKALDKMDNLDKGAYLQTVSRRTGEPETL